MLNKKAKAPDSKARDKEEALHPRLSDLKIDLNQSFPKFFIKEDLFSPPSYSNIFAPIKMTEKTNGESNLTKFEQGIHSILNIFKSKYEVNVKNESVDFLWSEIEQTYKKYPYDSVVKFKSKDLLTDEGYTVFSILYYKHRSYPVVVISKSLVKECKSSTQLKDCLEKLI